MSGKTGNYKNFTSSEHLDQKTPPNQLQIVIIYLDTW